MTPAIPVPAVNYGSYLVESTAYVLFCLGVLAITIVLLRSQRRNAIKPAVVLLVACIGCLLASSFLSRQEEKASINKLRTQVSMVLETTWGLKDVSVSEGPSVDGTLIVSALDGTAHVTCTVYNPPAGTLTVTCL